MTKLCNEILLCSSIFVLVNISILIYVSSLYGLGSFLLIYLKKNTDCSISHSEDLFQNLTCKTQIDDIANVIAMGLGYFHIPLILCIILFGYILAYQLEKRHIKNYKINKEY